MTNSNDAPSCLRAGWIFYLKTTLGKSWRKKWMTVSKDGAVSLAEKKTSKRAKTFDIRHDCMFVWTGSQCQHLLPPMDAESSSLIELLLTGDRRLALCALSRDEAELWYRCIETARAETQLPATTRSNTANNTDNITAEGSTGCCGMRPTSSKVNTVAF